MSQEPWLPGAQAALQHDPAYANVVMDEWWQSIPMPDLIEGKPFVVFYAGPNKPRAAGGRTPAAPGVAAYVSYPETKVQVQRPALELAPTPKDEACFDDPEVFAQARKDLLTRGKDLLRHNALLDEFLRKGWWAEHGAKTEHHAVAHEWNELLSRLLMPNFAWLYKSAAHFLRQWIDRNK